MADERIRYENGTDTGARTDADAIAPIVDGEPVAGSTLSRAPENLRYRTEVVRNALETGKYLDDTDLEWFMSGGNALGVGQTLPKITSWTPGSGPFWGIFETDSPIVVQPMDSVGADSTGSLTWTFDDTSTVGSIDFTSKLLAAEGADLIEARLEYTATTGTLTVETIGSPVTTFKVTVSDDGSKTVQDLYNALAVVPAITVVLQIVGNPVLTTAITAAGTPQAAGSYPLSNAKEREMHRISPADLVSFFATAANTLQDGDTLAIYYNELVETGAFFIPTSGLNAGRRQACVTNGNLDIGPGGPTTSGELFNTTRYPEYVPLAIPICKRVENDLIFVDGTYIQDPAALSAGFVDIYLGEHAVTVNRIADGANTIQVGAYIGTGPTIDLLDLTVASVQINLEAMVDAINSKGSIDVNETNVSGDWTITGRWTLSDHLGVGTAPNDNDHIIIQNAAVTMPAGDYNGIFHEEVITAINVTSDDFMGYKGRYSFDVAGVIDNFGGFDLEVTLVGTSQVDLFQGLNLFMTSALGTINSSMTGIRTFTSHAGSTTGDLAGLYTIVVNNGTVTGNSYLLRASGGGGGVDYGIHVVGASKHYLEGDLGINIDPDAVFHTALSAQSGDHYFDVYSDSTPHSPELELRRSHNDTIGTLTATATSDSLGYIRFKGVDSGSTSFVSGAYISATQNGAAGGTVPTDMTLATYSASGLNTSQLVLHNSGYVGINESAPEIQLGVDGGIASKVTFDNTTAGSPALGYDVSNINVLILDTPGSLVITNLSGGVHGQFLFIMNISATQGIILTNADATGAGNQAMYMSGYNLVSTDLIYSSAGTLDPGLYAGVTLVCDKRSGDGAWYTVSSGLHAA